MDILQNDINKCYKMNVKFTEMFEELLCNLDNRLDVVNSKQLEVQKYGFKLENDSKKIKKYKSKNLLDDKVDFYKYENERKNIFYYQILDLVFKPQPKQKDENQSKNKFEFTEEEDKRLLEIISQNKMKNWKEIASHMNGRTDIECYRRNLEKIGSLKKTKWSKKEDNILKKCVDKYGTNNWSQVANYLDGRSNFECFYRWEKEIDPKIKKGKWNIEEDMKLALAVKVYGNKNWIKISEHLEKRTDIKCRERYCNILDPLITNVQWTFEEEEKLKNIIESYNLVDPVKNKIKWSKVAELMGSRTDNQCARKWRNIQNRKHFHSYPKETKYKKVEIEDESCPIFKIEKVKSNNKEKSKKPIFKIEYVDKNINLMNK